MEPESAEILIVDPRPSEVNKKEEIKVEKRKRAKRNKLLFLQTPVRNALKDKQEQEKSNNKIIIRQLLPKQRQTLYQNYLIMKKKEQRNKQKIWQ